MKGGIRSIYSSNYSVTLYEILKSYSNHVMKKDFMRINIPRLPLAYYRRRNKKNQEHFLVDYLIGKI